MNLRLQFGRKLRKLRRERDLTQEQLAEMIGISVESISNIERGIFAPSFETLERLRDVFNLTVSEMFDFSEGE